MVAAPLRLAVLQRVGDTRNTSEIESYTSIVLGRGKYGREPWLATIRNYTDLSRNLSKRHYILVPGTQVWFWLFIKKWSKRHSHYIAIEKSYELRVVQYRLAVRPLAVGLLRWLIGFRLFEVLPYPALGPSPVPEVHCD